MSGPPALNFTFDLLGLRADKIRDGHPCCSQHSGASAGTGKHELQLFSRMRNGAFFQFFENGPLQPTPRQRKPSPQYNLLRVERVHHIDDADPEVTADAIKQGKCGRITFIRPFEQIMKIDSLVGESNTCTF